MTRDETVALLTMIDDALVRDNRIGVNALLKLIDWKSSAVGIDGAVTVLMTCKPARHQLHYWAQAVEQFYLRLVRDEPDRANNIIRHIRPPRD